MATYSKNQLKTYEVQVGGCALRLKSSHDSTTLNEILQVVEKQIAASKNQSKGAVSAQKTLALSCLNFAEELVFLKSTVSRHLDQLESAAQSVFSELKSSSADLVK